MDINLIPKTIIFRDHFTSISQKLEQDSILLLLGSRQVGKTYSLYWLINFLIEKKGVSPSQILFLDLENINLLNELEALDFDNFAIFLQKKGVDITKKSYIFIDEIQYLKYPAKFLKYIYDHQKNIKFIVTGSSSLEIRKKFTDSLTGRKEVFNIYSLNFNEFLQFKNLENLSALVKNNFWQDVISGQQQKLPAELVAKHEELKHFYEEFVLFGGYPKTVLLPADQRITLLQEIYSTYVRQDIKDMQNIENISAFNNLTKMLALQIGQLANLTNLANKIDVSRQTLEKYIFLLQATFVIELLSPYFRSKQKEITKMPKTYFLDNGLRNSAISNFNKLAGRVDAGSLIENAVFSELHKRVGFDQKVNFWRTQSGSEVDFIWQQKDDLIPIEVKTANYSQQKITSGLKSFIDEYKVKNAVMATDGFLPPIKKENTTIYFLPTYLF